jgi:hypothetical protein
MHELAEPKTAAQLLSRLREVEKIAIRMAAGEDALEHLRTGAFQSDMISPAVMKEVKQILTERGVTMPPPNTQTWAI